VSQNTKIEWTDATWNPIRGCSRVSEGCRNCYAERVAARFSGIGQPFHGLAEMKVFGTIGSDVPDRVEPHWTGKVELIDDVLSAPLHWKKPRSIFVNSMSDIFHEKVNPEWIDRIFCTMAVCPQHTFQILTKRPAQMRDWFSTGFRGNATSMYIEKALVSVFPKLSPMGIPAWPLPNVWLGVSVEDQKTADERIPLLLQTPAAVRWVSYEPALGPVDLRAVHYENVTEIDSLTGDHGVYRPLAGKSERKISWVVCGGESGPGARAMNPEWARSARDQCQAAGVPFFFKQWGEWLNSSQLRPAFTDAELDRTTFRTVWRDGGPDPSSGKLYSRVGKKRAGRMLDGQEWNEYPVSRRDAELHKAGARSEGVRCRNLLHDKS